MGSPPPADAPLETPLNKAHRALGAKMVPFAGYDMPVQYPMGVLAEHNWTRTHAGLFDVSHMGQCFFVSDSWERTATALEELVPADLLGLKPGQQRYSQLLNEDGGVLDDLMITRMAVEGFDGMAYVVVNAGCKAADYVHFAASLPPTVDFAWENDLALLALQGPEAVAVLGSLVPDVITMPFMTGIAAEIPALGVNGEAVKVHISRSGYTGEDGFEISIEEAFVEDFWNLLLKDERVRPIGLGARDSLRLEAGLCLYGHELDATTSPVEAGLLWSIQKRRRNEGGFPGAARIQKEIAEGTARTRVGILPDGRAPARDGTKIVDPATGNEIGVITSGGFGPSLNGPVAIGYIASAFAAPETQVDLIVRGKAMPARIHSLPFIPNRFYRAAKA